MQIRMTIRTLKMLNPNKISVFVFLFFILLCYERELVATLTDAKKLLSLYTHGNQNITKNRLHCKIKNIVDFCLWALPKCNSPPLKSRKTLFSILIISSGQPVTGSQSSPAIMAQTRRTGQSNGPVLLSLFQLCLTEIYNVYCSNYQLL